MIYAYKTQDVASCKTLPNEMLHQIKVLTIHRVSSSDRAYPGSEFFVANI